MRKIALLLLTILLVAGAGFAQVPERVGPGGGGAAFEAPEGSTLWDQTDNAGTNSVTSQNFEASNDAFDNQAADDFTVPAGFSWDVDQVQVSGVYFNGPGPVASVNVLFYADSAGLPGATECTFSGVVPTDTAGSFDIILPAACNLAAGNHWVSVQANLDFTPGGQWGWTERTVQTNNPSAWQNPNDGFGSGCTTWSPRVSGCGVGLDPDLIFLLAGTEQAEQSVIEIPTLGLVGLGALVLLLGGASVAFLLRRRSAS